MKGINLLPEELKPKTYALKLSKDLRKVALYSIVVFLLSAVVLGAVFVSLSVRQNLLQRNKVSLEAEVKTLSQTEQRLVLVQDRLKKINGILSERDTSDTLSTFQAILNNLPEGVTIEAVEMTANSLFVSVAAESSQNLTRFFSNLVALNFPNVLLGSFTFTEELGYKVGVKINN